MRVAGIDEVGYGARLGPFVVCAVVFDVPRLPIDLWQALDIGRTPRKGRLVVADSKLVFTQSRGIESLEPTVLAFMKSPPTLQAFCDKLGVHIEAPWFRDVPLPKVDALPSMTRARAAVLDADAFNAGLRRLGNKHDLHFEVVASLIREVLDADTIDVGKLSGRAFYLPGLMKHVGGTWMTLGERAACSRYVYEGRATVSFIRDGDRSEFTIALASMIGKYLRERCMILFNEYWSKRAPKAGRTAGYGTQANEFFERVRGHLGELQPSQVYREK